MNDATIPLFGYPINIKAGVYVKDFNYFVATILAVYQGLCAEQKVTGAITGGYNEKVYAKEKDHRDGRALDLRSSCFAHPVEIQGEMARRLRAYGAGFVVLYLDHGSGLHFHVAYRGPIPPA